MTEKSQPDKDTFIGIDIGVDSEVMVHGYRQDGNLYVEGIIRLDLGDLQNREHPSDLVLCLCGHPRSEHFRETQTCMHSTPAQTWACACGEFTDA